MSSIPTPPATTLSTPSPTERLSTPDLPPAAPMALISSHPIYLIVATSILPPRGIGLRGQLPWPPLKADMSFFKRVTTRTPPSYVANTDMKIRNAVIMGRKTWDSIPPRFRPLRDRINVVVSRSKTTQDLAGSQAASEDLLVVSDLPGAVSALKRLVSDRTVELGKTFIIGGSAIYRAAYEELLIAHGVPLRVILTQVRRRDGNAIECDTFFPTVLRQGQLSGATVVTSQATPAELEEWVGEELPQRNKENIVKSDDGRDDWLQEGEMQIRVLGQEIEKR